MARMLTVGSMALGSFFSVAAAALLATWPYLGDAGFLGLLFAVVALQTRGPRAVATGILSVMSSYLTLFLRVTPAQVSAVLLACVEHLGAPTKAALDVTLDNLEAALSLLAARLRTDGWSALVWRRRL